MPRFSRPRSRRLYRVATVIAALSSLIGFWRVFIEGARRPGLFWQLLFPLLILWLALTLHRRSRSS